MERITHRLVLREFTLEDIESTHRYAGDMNCVGYMLWGPNTFEDTKKFVVDAIANQTIKPRRKYDFALIDRQGRHIGGCGIYLDNTFRKAEIGWILWKEYWHQGYGSEAAKALIRFGFDELELDEIVATCDARNIASARVMEKNKMRLKALRKNHRQDRYDVNMFHDQLEYSIERKN